MCYSIKKELGVPSQYKDGLSRYVDLHYKNKSRETVIGIPMLVRQHLYIKTDPGGSPIGRA